MHRLSARTVEALKKPGIYADGAGLYLRVQGASARSWVYIFHLSGKRREMGLGAPPSVSLARARQRAQSIRESVADGIDPIASKRVRRHAPTFGDLAHAFIEDRTATVRSDKSIARWKRAIGSGGYAHDLRELQVDRIQTEDVLTVLRPLWESHPSSAGLLRGYIETVLNIAKVSGHRSGDNPATWKGHLEHILPARQRLSRGHHAAMPFADVPLFYARLGGPCAGPIFPGRRDDIPLSNMAMDMVLRRMKVAVTVHGFRSSFRDWAGEMTSTPREVAEAALAHTIGNSAELAYRRGDALEKRRVLMDSWAEYCAARSGKAVTPERCSRSAMRQERSLAFGRKTDFAIRRDKPGAHIIPPPLIVQTMTSSKRATRSRTEGPAWCSL